MAPTSKTRAEQSVPLRPTSLHLALALHVVHSKPLGHTVRDYILQLRQHISSVRRGSQERYQRRLDAAAYWQNQCKLLEEERQNLRNRIVVLERLSEANIEKPANSEATTVTMRSVPQNRPVRTMSPKKRDNHVKDNENVSRPAKKAKKSSSSMTPHGTTSSDVIEEDLGMLDDGMNGRLIESMWELLKSYRSSSSSPLALAYHLNQTSISISATLRSLCKDCDSDAENVAEYSVTFQRRQEDQISATLTAVTRAYSSLIFGVSRLTSTEGERSIHGSVIYSTVRMFKDILLLISDDAVRPHQHSLLCSIENRATRRSRNHIKAIRDNNMPNAIASFLTTALSALDSGSPSHREVFEGYLFVLLDRLGKILYLFTFGRSRAATIEEDLVDANLLDNDTIREHAQVEASYLLKILERALDLGAQHLNDPSTSVGTATVGFKSSTKPTAAASRLPCPKKSVLSQRAKNRLQHTLINAVFGPSKDDDDRDFSDVLRLPAQCSALAKPSKVDERDISTRFTKELWTLLGWDILAKSDWQ